MSSFSTSYLVLGGGIAGVSAAQTLHLLDSEADITLVTATELVKTVTELTHLTKLLSSFNVINTIAQILKMLVSSSGVQMCLVKVLQLFS